MQKKKKLCNSFTAVLLQIFCARGNSTAIKYIGTNGNLHTRQSIDDFRRDPSDIVEQWRLFRIEGSVLIASTIADGKKVTEKLINKKSSYDNFLFDQSCL